MHLPLIIVSLVLQKLHMTSILFFNSLSFLCHSYHLKQLKSTNFFLKLILIYLSLNYKSLDRLLTGARKREVQQLFKQKK